MENKLPFKKENYQWMITGVVVLILGFVVMSLDQEPHGFGALGLIWGPIIVMAGFIIGLYSILRKPIQ